MTNLKQPNRGEIWTTHLVGAGKEQQGYRPVLVISDDALNHSRFGLVIVVPLTTNTIKIKTRVLIEPPEGGIEKTSSIMCEQILRLDIENRLLQRLGRVSNTLFEVAWRLAFLLGIE